MRSLAAVLVLVAVACSAASDPLEGFTNGEVEVGGQTLTVALAETSPERSRGLRGIESLPGGLDGMLFVFDGPTTTSFTMQDTLVPLDIWWFDSEGRLLGSAGMEPCTSTPCPSYGSPGQVSWALETPSGELELVSGDMLNVTSGS